MKPRFTIAHILLFTAIIGLIYGWYLDRTQLNNRCQANKESLQMVVASVNIYDSEIQRPLKTLFLTRLTQDQNDDIQYLRHQLDYVKGECQRAYDFFRIQFDRAKRVEIK
jgi:hypothetical protein